MGETLSITKCLRDERGEYLFARFTYFALPWLAVFATFSRGSLLLIQQHNTHRVTHNVLIYSLSFSIAHLREISRIRGAKIISAENCLLWISLRISPRSVPFEPKIITIVDDNEECNFSRIS